MNNACSIKGEKQTCPLPFERGQARRMKHERGLYTSSLCPCTAFPPVNSWLNGKFRAWLYYTVRQSGETLFYLIGEHDWFVCVYLMIIWSSDISVDACQRSGCPHHRPLSWNFIQRQTSSVGGLGHIRHLHFSHISYASQRNGTCNRSLYIRFVSTEDSQQIPAIFPWTESTLKIFQQFSAK